MNIKGWRTVGSNVLGLIFAILAVNNIDMPADAQAEIVAGLFAIMNVILRFYTDTRIGQGMSTLSVETVESSTMSIKAVEPSPPPPTD